MGRTPIKARSFFLTVSGFYLKFVVRCSSKASRDFLEAP
jgi:hypothetical protein